jgi:hypothetical protein
MIFALMILAIQKMDVFSLREFAKDPTNVSHLIVMLSLENASLNKFFVMMEINAALTDVKRILENA